MRFLIWDFDGTLGYRSRGWTGALLDVIHQEAPEWDITADKVRPYLQTGFPWHTPNCPHPHIKSSEQWWDMLDPVFELAFKGIGFGSNKVRILIKKVRHIYPDLKYWYLFDDTLPILHQLSSQGWTHVVLSNHVPELQEIIHYLDLTKYISQVFNSAKMGYEKPHPQAFRTVIQALGNTEAIWMIGDSMSADISGAKQVGICSILVRKYHEGAPRYSETLLQVPAIVNG